MTDSEKLQALWERAAIVDLMHRYATAVDSKDWATLRSLFVDEIGAEMVGLSADLGVPKNTSPERLIEAFSSGLGQYTATQHSMSNHRIELNGDRATCITYIIARHVRKDAKGGQSIYDVGGYYTNEMVRTADGWKIGKWKLTGTWETNTGS
jgi:SnoaL-like domain